MGGGGGGGGPMLRKSRAFPAQAKALARDLLAPTRQPAVQQRLPAIPAATATTTWESIGRAAAAAGAGSTSQPPLARQAATAGVRAAAAAVVQPRTTAPI